MKWFLQRVLAAVAAVLVVALGAALLVRLQYTGEPASWAVSNQTNALWMGHAWVDGRYGERELAELKPRITEGGISDVYVHVGPLDYDGRLDPAKHPELEGFLRMFRRELPDVRVSAWVGQRVEEGELDLGDEATRTRVIEAAAGLVDAGFDGVHYNFEPVPNNDPGLLALLESTREELGEEVLLSSAVPTVEPLGGLAFTLGLLASKDPFWSSGYLGRVAEHLDQVAVMSYDTGMPTEGMYGGFVVRQTQVAMDAVPPDVRLLMGVPAYPDDHAARNPEAETTAAATRAIRIGLSEGGRRRDEFGTALYADFSATRGQWEAYLDGWVGPGGGEDG
ncbi:glycoside hydrolase family 18 protein [Streptomonospora litoralis]|uniref:Glycosyl hydrolases family 18 n=1 Tax=Streptomonospora litoralis TaxID=2498135 RepID=A0A4P6PZT6_9ACTN|nr:glycosyl hydrolase family 18 protein [Streptomonospora litoralis]QBI53300.1 Glycosyl hydrolases family 18 [Streptomonospora litoralis]